MLTKRLSIAVIAILAVLVPMASFADVPSLDRQLLEAAAAGDVGKVRDCLQRGARVDARDTAQRTALLLATRGNHLEAARALIDAGADVNAKDAIQDSPYLYAGAEGRLDILRLTLAHGADVRSTNRYGGTALIPASEHGHVETVRALIAAGVDVDHVNKLHWTALLEAIILNDGGPRQAEVVRQLVAAKADVNLADGKGVTPLQHARRRGYAEIERILLAADAR